MKFPISTIAVRSERDVVAARQHARKIAALLGFEPQDQTRIATAVSELGRNACSHGGGGAIDFAVEGRARPQALVVAIADHGPGINDPAAVLRGEHQPAAGAGMGILGAKRLMDSLDLASSDEGTTATLRKLLPVNAPLADAPTIARIADDLGRLQPHDAVAEVQRQDQELLQALGELRRRQDELRRVNRELEDTNRGVVALYAELEERAEHLRRADEVKTRFLSNMTHEFRTPVNSILALSQLLLDRTDGELSPEQERQAAFIKRAAQNLSDLVNDLLDLAKAAAGKIVVYPAPFSINDLFSSLRGMLRPLRADARVDLTFDEPTGPASLVSDESKVAQILRNLISNALKFTERGEVRVAYRPADDGATALFTVADTGIGIAPEDHDRIFEEFGQLEHPIQRRLKGTGLGLPLSKRLAELLGGRITVRSEPGRGSTFTLAIPAVYRPPAGSCPRRPAIDERLVPLLAVDDDPDELSTYAEILRDSTYQLFTAAGPHQARENLRSLRPAAVLLALRPQSDDAWRFLTELVAWPAADRSPVIALTPPDSCDRAHSFGADACLAAPPSKAALLSELGRVIGRPREKRALVIDDDPAFRYTVSHMLAADGWNITEAADGDDGLVQIRASHPAVVLVDLVMPRTDGYAILAALRADDNTTGLPVVVCTSQELTPAQRDRILAHAAIILPKASLSSDALRAALVAAHTLVAPRADILRDPAPRAADRAAQTVSEQ